MHDLTMLRRLLVLVLLSTISIACGGPQTANNAPTDSKFPPRTTGTRGGTLNYRITAPPSTFNYLVANNEPSILLSFYLLSSRPIEFDHATQKYRGALAETWTLAADRQTVDLKLRDGVKFSDGKPLKIGRA